MSAAGTESEEELFDEEGESDNEEEVDEDLAETVDAVDAVDQDQEMDEDSDGDEDSDDSQEEDDEDEDGSSQDGDEGDDDDEQSQSQQDTVEKPETVTRASPKSSGLPRSISPAQARRTLFRPAVAHPRSYTIDAICALPHPVATHALAASLCMTHLLTGSDDGYIRDYDIYAACNGKTFLTAPQRHHCGFVEGIMKAGVIRSWWENAPSNTKTSEDPVEPTYSPVYSLLLHSDALWGLSGSKDGRIGLYTVRHQPGTMCHTLHAHKGPVSAMALLPDQKGFFSVGWDGNALQWDLNTGQIARSFPSQGAQLSAVALRPVYLGADTGLMAYGASVAPATAPPSDAFRSPTSSPIEQVPPAITSQPRNTESSNVPASTKPNDSADVQHNVELKSEASYDPLFDEPDLENAEGAFFDRPARSSFSSPEKPAPAPQKPAPSGLAVPGEPVAQFRTGKPVTNTNASTGGHYRNPVLDSSMAAKFSHDVLLTAAIDGQVILWDRRVQSPSGGGVGRLEMADKTPPWCVSACWSSDGMHIYAGRRNGTVDVWDTRQLGRDGAQAPRLLRTLRNPPSSGEVSCVAAFPDGRHIACASNDNIRLWNTSESPEESRSRTTPFKIVTGHHGGNVSQMLIDPAARFMISASGNRGWFGDSTRTVLVHEIKALL